MSEPLFTQNMRNWSHAGLLAWGQGYSRYRRFLCPCWMCNCTGWVFKHYNFSITSSRETDLLLSSDFWLSPSAPSALLRLLCGVFIWWMEVRVANAYSEVDLRRCPFVGGNLMEAATLVADGAASWISVMIEIIDFTPNTHTTHTPRPYWLYRAVVAY